MKRIFNIFFIAAATVAASSSCAKFLDKSPEENLTLDDVFASRDYTEAFLTHVYSWTPSECNMADNGGSYRNPYTAGCDELECAYGGAYGHLINNGSWSPQNIEKTKIWAECYMSTRKCTMFLERVDGCPADADQIRRWKGEAHFLRAWFYWLGFRAHGPIPIYDRVLDPSENIEAHRESADAVVEFIVRDCEKAAEYLYDRDRWPDEEAGRATRLAALALKSRALLYIASPLYNGNTDMAELKDPIDGSCYISQTYDPQKWVRAAEAARDCLKACQADGRSLYRKYSDPIENCWRFFMDPWNDEVLWAKNIYTYEHMLRCCEPISFTGASIINPTQEMVDAYEMENGLAPIIGYTDDGLNPIINPESGYTEEGFAETADPQGRWQKGVSNMYVNREPRFYAHISFAGAIWKYDYPAYNTNKPHTLEFWYTGIDGKGKAGSDYCKTGYLMRKLVHRDYRRKKSVPNNQTWNYIRMAEIYLNLAEAANESNGPTQEVYDAVNEIRNRAGLPNLPTGLTKDEMRDKIKHERRIELAFEVHRFFDVRRWKDAEITENKPIHSMNIYAGTHISDPEYYKRIKVEDRVFEAPKHYFMPINQEEIDKSQHHLLVQNLGYTTTN